MFLVEVMLRKLNWSRDRISREFDTNANQHVALNNSYLGYHHGPESTPYACA